MHWKPHTQSPEKHPVTGLIAVWDELIGGHILYADIWEWRGDHWRNEATGRILDKDDQPYWWALETDLLSPLKQQRECAA